VTTQTYFKSTDGEEKVGYSFKGEVLDFFSKDLIVSLIAVTGVAEKIVPTSNPRASVLNYFLHFYQVIDSINSKRK
jgi:hypothetical protein